MSDDFRDFEELTAIEEDREKSSSPPREQLMIDIRVWESRDEEITSKWYVCVIAS